MTKEEVAEVDLHTKRVCDMASYRCTKDDAADIAEYVACEIMDLAEWMCPSPAIARMVAARICQTQPMPQHATHYIKRYFDLVY